MGDEFAWRKPVNSEALARVRSGEGFLEVARHNIGTCMDAGESLPRMRRSVQVQIRPGFTYPTDLVGEVGAGPYPIPSVDQPIFNGQV